MKMKTIKSKMVLVFTLLSLISVFTATSILNVKFQGILVQNVNQLTLEMVQKSAELVQERIGSMFYMLREVANNDIILNPNAPIDNKKKVLQKNIELYGHEDMGIADMSGDIWYANGESSNIKGTDYFEAAKSGKEYITDPLVCELDNKLEVIYSVPIKNQNGQVFSVLVVVRDGNEISNQIKNMKFLNTGYAYVINKEGNVIAHPNQESVDKHENTIKDAQTDSSLKELAQIETNMIEGKTGSGEYTYNGKHKISSYSPVGTSGWSIAFTVEYDEIMHSIYSIKLISIFINCIFIAICSISTYFIACKISNPLKKLSDTSEIIANGDFTVDIDDEILKREDEIGSISKSIELIRSSIGYMIDDIKKIGNDINERANGLSLFSSELNDSSSNVSESILEVANGNTQQAQNLSETSNVFNNFSDEMQSIGNNIDEVHKNNVEIGLNLKKSKQNTSDMKKSVENVNEHVEDFVKSIKNLELNMDTINIITDLINSIADQTNLLALNAAIEAARAGESGKGFAVVADEIRKLAEQSRKNSQDISKIISDSSENTKDIIKKTQTISDEFENQKNNIDDVINVFDNIAGSITNVIPKIINVNEEFDQIKLQKDNILVNIEEITAVSQQVSASSEQIYSLSVDMNNGSKDLYKNSQELLDKIIQIIQRLDKFKT